MSYNQSFEDINNNIKNQNKNNIFREYLINNDSFIATNKFFISQENDNGMIEFRIFNVNSINEKLTPYLCDTYDSNDINIYISMKNSLYSNENSNFDNYIDLVTISDITFSIDDIKIEKRTIIKKFIENDCEINDKLFEELYFNTDFSKKINIELPKKYNNKNIILENMDIKKKFLFKVDFIELNRNFYQENNIINHI
jgi:hypothetical protein